MYPLFSLSSWSGFEWDYDESTCTSCVLKEILLAGAVKEAIEALRRNNVSAFVLDLRNNR